MLNLSCKKEDTSLGRFYRTPNGRFPSVTTIIDRYEDKQFLEKWKNNIGEKEANEIKEKAAVRGTRVHHAIEKTLKGKPHNLDENELTYYNNILPFLAKIKPTLLEEQLYWANYGFGFAGTVDILLNIDLSLLKDKDGNSVGSGTAYVTGDFKTWRSPKYASGLLGRYLQLAAYSAAINQRTNVMYQLNKGLIIGATSKQLYLYYLDENAINFYWNHFLLMTKCFHNKNHFDWFKFKREACNSSKNSATNKWETGSDNFLARRVYI